MPRLTLRLMGPVEMVGPDGENLNPRGMKARGALAIIGASHGMRVTRSRLQDLLFSDRDPEHGNASLRQVLREIRLALGKYRDTLTTGPGWVGLDGDMLALDLTARLSLDGQVPEFASDLDIDDPEFEDWIRDVRQHMAAHAPVVSSAPGPDDRFPTIVARPAAGVDEGAAVMAEMIMSEALGRVADLLPVEVVTDRSQAARSALIVESLASRSDDDFDLVVKITHQPSGRIMFSRRFQWQMRDVTAKMHEFAANVCLAVVRVMDAAATYDAVLSISFSDIFSFTKDRLLRADRTLANVGERINPAVVLSLRAWLRSTLTFERLTDDPLGTLAEAADLSAQARDQGPLNATAFAVSSFVESYLAHPHVDINKRHSELAFEFASRAVQLDPQNPMARLAYSRSLSRIRRFDQAAAEAQAGLQSAYSNLNPANWHMEIGLASLQRGDYTNALRHLEAVHQHAPDNRPALRFLSALRFHLNDQAGAQQALQSLKKLEPDFTLELMASPSYPVDSLREGQLLGITRSGLI